MKKLQQIIQKLAHLLIFSSVFMGIGAVSMTLLSFELIGYNSYPPVYIWFVFSSATFLYSLHRVVGIEKVKDYEDQGRFLIIKKYQKQIWVFGILAGVGSAITFFQLDRHVQIQLILPAAISLLYVLPVFPKNKRLRDYPFVKIAMIGGIWGWITMAIPIFYKDGGYALGAWIAIFAQMSFFIASALPFDIRDRGVDEISMIKTIPTELGEKTSKWISWFFLCAFVSISLYLIKSGSFVCGIEWAYVMYFLICSICILLANEEREHLYFTVFMDGTLIVLPVLVWAFLWGI